MFYLAESSSSSVSVSDFTAFISSFTDAIPPVVYLGIIGAAVGAGAIYFIYHAGASKVLSIIQSAIKRGKLHA